VALTEKQKRLIGEIDEIADELNLDHRVLVDELKGMELTTYLELAERGLISSAIVHEYTFIDDSRGGAPLTGTSTS
jgi:hypothetical protein